MTPAGPDAAFDSVPAFDALAADYDRTFTGTALGRRYRDATWRRFDACFSPGDRVLEVGCGTGTDAIELARRGLTVVATDASTAMVAEAQAKVSAAGLDGRVCVCRLDIEDLASWTGPGPNGPDAGPDGRFDGLLSNFGALNCVSDLASAADAMATRLRPGGIAMLCLMGRWVPWEWAWFLWHREPARAVRRLRRTPTWRALALSYPSPRALRRAFAPHFEARRTWALGALLPPPAADAWAGRHPRLIAALDAVERRSEPAPPLAWLADHYVVELVRR